MKSPIYAFALVSFWSFAHQFNSHAAETPLPVVSAAEIQPEARRLIDGMMAAYKDLKSISATIKLHETNPAAKQFNFRLNLEFQKPNKANILVHNQRGPLTAISDGTHIYLTMPERGKKGNSYHQMDAPRDQEGFARILDMFLAGGPGLSDFMQGKNPLDRPFVKSAWTEKSTVVGGVPVDIVVIESVGPKGRSKTTLAIGRTDHLLRRSTGVSTPFDGTASTTETETNFDVNLNPDFPPSVFVFTPPKGSQRLFLSVCPVILR